MAGKLVNDWLILSHAVPGRRGAKRGKLLERREIDFRCSRTRESKHLKPADAQGNRDARCGALQPATSDVCADWLGIAALGGDADREGVAPRW